MTMKRIMLLLSGLACTGLFIFSIWYLVQPAHVDDPWALTAFSLTCIVFMPFFALFSFTAAAQRETDARHTDTGKRRKETGR